MILLDTHAVLWMANNDPSLGPHSRSIIQKARDDGELAVSAISFWEISLLAAKGRLELLQSTAELRAELLATRITEIPLSGDIAIEAVSLDTLHGDPADRFIVATALVHDAALVTADRPLLRWNNKLTRQDANK